MRVSREAAAASKARITGEAARLMRENGIEGTSVADVMAAAGMTTGGFYKHFESKDDLTAAAVREAFDGILTGLARSADAQGAQAAQKAYFETYLSEAHVRNPGGGCPVASLGPEAARAARPVGAAFEDGIEKTIGLLAGKPLTRQERAELIRQMSTLIGAVILARAVGEGPLGDEILAAARGAI
jgi:TetR/AcrR family transcriptional repressor of nem operon